MATDEWLEIEDVVQIYKIAKTTVYEKTNPNKTPKEHLMPCYKPTGKLLFKKAELDKWVEKHKVKAS